MRRAPSEARDVLQLTQPAAGLVVGARVLGFVLPSGAAVAVLNGNRYPVPADAFRVVAVDIAEHDVTLDARAEEYQEAPIE